MNRVVLALAFLLAACASSHGARERQQTGGEAGASFEDDGPFAPVAEEDFGAALGDVLVQEAERCCQQIGLPFEAAPSRLANFMRAFVPADPSSGARFQPAAAGACLARIETRACLRSKDMPPAENPCQALYQHGTRKPGEPCTSSWDCAAGGADTVVLCVAQEAQACLLQRILQEGEPCTSPGWTAQCASHLFCDPVRSECVPRAALGQPCVTGPSFGDTCAAGAVCDRQGSKRCVRPRKVGEPCAALEDCEDLACVDGVCREALAVRAICREARPGPLRR